MNSFDKQNQLKDFIAMAKKSTYAASDNAIDSLNKEIKYEFLDNDFTYNDTYVGQKSFSGFEYVSYKGTPIWSLNYFGNSYEESPNYEFLKLALSQCSSKFPYRGPELLEMEDMLYKCSVEGDFNSFKGEELIYRNAVLIYKCIFIGGIIN